MKLLSLEVKNFKGIKHQVVDAKGNSLVISGKNATGKSTLIDSYIFLLFGKDSTDRSKFSIKPLDEDNNEIHNLECCVRGVFDVDGQNLELERKLVEAWSKIRGTTEMKFKNEFQYFVNGIKVGKAAYDNQIKQIIDQDMFKILSNATHFMESVEWKDRRKTLFSMAGGVSTDDVISSDEKLAGLKELLFNTTLDNLKTKTAQELKKIRDELKNIPVRITELFNNKSEVTGTEESLKEQREKLKAELDELNKDKHDDTLANELTIQIGELKDKKLHTGRRLQNEYDTKCNSLSSRLSDADRLLREVIKDIKHFTTCIDRTNKNIKISQDKINNLRERYVSTKKTTFTISDSDSHCKLCGQPLPDTENNSAELKKKFLENKTLQLSRIKELGDEEKKTLSELKESLSSYQETLETCKESKAELEKQLEEVKAEYEKLEALRPNLNTNEELLAIQVEIDDLNEQLGQTSVDIPNPRITEIANEISKIDGDLALLRSNERTQKRIDELEKQQKNLADKEAEKERIQILCEDYIKVLVSITEDKINNLFTNIKWKLFKDQMNGGISECCEALINGVPYADANRAAKINAGLDFIKGLSNYIGKSFPVWIDNSEAVNQLMETGLQTIELKVTEDEQLTITMG